MIKTFPIEFVRKALEQTLYKEHLLNSYFFGGKNQINLSSFYQQLKNQDEIDRFVETFRDLTEQQNRTGLIGNGIILSPENPTITNLYSCLIIPMTWTCSMRCILENRDQMLETINNLISELKGSKVDIAQLNCIDENGNKYAEPFVVGTIGNNEGAPSINSGDYIGEISNVNEIPSKISAFVTKGIGNTIDVGDYLYVKHNNLLKVCCYELNRQNLFSRIGNATVLSDDRTIELDVALDDVYDSTDISEISFKIVIEGDNHQQQVVLNVDEGTTIENSWTANGVTWLRLHYILDQDITDYIEDYETFTIQDMKILYEYEQWNIIVDDGTYENIIFPPEHTSFEKYKLSLSFESLRCDTPSTLNAKEYCELSFGGSATLVNAGVQLGNDLIKIWISKLGFQAEQWVSFEQDGAVPGAFLEPLEMPSGSNANTQISQLVSNNFIGNSHTDAIALTLQYTFIYDKNIPLLKQWFNYARYGVQPDGEETPFRDGITPNIIYEIYEIWSSWGDFEIVPIRAKIVESIDIENTESDTLTLSVTMQIQGENVSGNGGLQ